MLLADQDRSRWDHSELNAGREALDRALALRGHGPYVLQAAIASLQAEDRPDWPQIVALYGELAGLTGSPVVELNRAVAIAEAGSPEAALGIVGHARARRVPLPALHARGAAAPARRDDEAARAYRRALELTDAEQERRFLERRLAELEVRSPH